MFFMAIRHWLCFSSARTYWKRRPRDPCANSSAICSRRCCTSRSSTSQVSKAGPSPSSSSRPRSSRYCATFLAFRGSSCSESLARERSPFSPISLRKPKTRMTRDATSKGRRFWASKASEVETSIVPAPFAFLLGGLWPCSFSSAPSTRRWMAVLTRSTCSTKCRTSSASSGPRRSLASSSASMSFTAMTMSTDLRSAAPALCVALSTLPIHVRAWWKCPAFSM
mmetsp:Transcript_16313/g.62045  ORF Transcript_16313/g.62045 Transcript_16313/m.62045 type:complete len:224 (-) Transcript_16313:224-895(-)